MTLSQVNDLPTPPDGKVGWPWKRGETSQHIEKAIRGRPPSISIVMPSYNQAEYLEGSIRSVLLQEYPDLELIVIDGGSTDGSRAILQKYSPWISYWVSEEDRGQTHALNKGMKRCTGDLFNWVNSDDYLAPNTLWCVAKHMVIPDVHVLCGRARQFDHCTGETVRFVQVRMHSTVERTIVQGEFRQLPTYYRLDVLRSLGRLNEKLNFTMDSEMWVRYLLNYGQEHVRFTDTVLGHFRLHESSKTMSQRGSFQKERFSLLCQLHKGTPSSSILSIPCSGESPEEEALEGTQYSLQKLDQRKIQSYLVQDLAQYCRSRISALSFYAAVVYALILHPVRNVKQYKYIFGTLLFPQIHHSYERWFKEKNKKDYFIT